MILQKERAESQILKKNISFSLGIKVTLIVSLITVICIKYLDAGIALRVFHFLRSVHTLNKVTESIPDFLPHFVGISTIFMWAMYFYRLQKKKFDVETQFLKLAATVLPAAYLIKTLLKFVFGRTFPRDWLIHNHQLTFHWFSFWSSSFPSGHMVVFAAFGTAILIYYPRYRSIVLIFLILLGAALIGTNYHFLSDVIAGAYIGIITTYFIYYFYKGS